MRRWRDDFVPVLEKIVGPESRSAADARGRAPRAARKVARGPPAARDERAVAAGVRAARVRASGDPGGPALLQRPARSRPALQGLRPPHPDAARGRRQGADVRRRLGGTGARAGRCGRARPAARSAASPRRGASSSKAAGRSAWRRRTGERIRARHFVASGLNPQQTFLELMDEAHVPQAWRDKAAAFTYNLIAPLFGLNLDLRERPVYAAEKEFPQLSKALMVILGLEGYAQFPEIVAHHEQGRDSAHRHVGQHADRVRSVAGAAGSPHRVHVGEAALPAARRRAQLGHGRRMRMAETMLTLWARYAPNLDGAVHRLVHAQRARHRAHASPNMREGDLLVGAFTHGQIGADRPFPGAGHYRGHVEGPLPVRLELAIRAATSPACPATTARRSCMPTSASRPTGRPSRRPTRSQDWFEEETGNERRTTRPARRHALRARARASTGYTLFAPMYGRNVWLIDMWGAIVHRWQVENLPGNYGQLLPNGRLLYAGRTLPPAIPEFGGNGGQLAEYDWDGKIVWEYRDPYLSHCFAPLANGNLLVAKWRAVPRRSRRASGADYPAPSARARCTVRRSRRSRATARSSGSGSPTSTSIPRSTSSARCIRATAGPTSTRSPRCPTATSWSAFAASTRLRSSSARADESPGAGAPGKSPGSTTRRGSTTATSSLFDNGAHRAYTTIDFSRVIEVDPRTNEHRLGVQGKPGLRLQQLHLLGRAAHAGRHDRDLRVHQGAPVRGHAPRATSSGNTSALSTTSTRSSAPTT